MGTVTGSRMEDGWGVGRLAVLLAACCVATVANAQPKPRQIAFVDPFRVGVPSSAGAVRVGKRAVLVHVLLSSRVMSRAEQVLLACDGSWVSSPRLTLPTGSGERSFEDLEKWAVENQWVPVHPIRFDDLGMTSLFAEPLRRVAGEICATARPEPRNLQLTVAQEPPEGGSVGHSHALVVGSAVRKRERVQMWVRSSELLQEMASWPDGRTMEANGKPILKAVPTGNYTMTRWTVDCDRLAIRKDVTREFSAYQQVLLETTVPPGSELQVVEPGSHEHAIGAAGCRVF